jgi:hypothetical protein
MPLSSHLATSFSAVIRRTPHEFKIACLNEIRALFPPNTTPFYAGFGNRDTDEISYLAVGIARGKIFTINPKVRDRSSVFVRFMLVHSQGLPNFPEPIIDASSDDSEDDQAYSSSAEEGKVYVRGKMGKKQNVTAREDLPRGREFVTDDPKGH